MKKRVAFVLGIICLACNLVACGEVDNIPVLTEAESKQIAEYASGLMLKYDAHHLPRLVDDKEIEAAYEKAYKKAELEYRVELYKEEVRKAEEEKKKEKDKNKGNKGEATPEVTYTMEQVLGIDPIFTLQYTGAELVTTYPSVDSETEVLIAMDALPGDQLYVLHFNLTNTSAEDQLCDILNQNLSYSLRINDEKSYKSEFTLLDDDLSIFMDTVPAGQSRIVSVIFELTDEEVAGMQSATFKIKSKDMSATIDL